MARALTRRNMVLLAILGGALLMIGSTQTWVTAIGVDDLSGVQEVEVPGTDLAETVTAMALVGLAAALALSIARRVLRHIIGVLMAAAGVFAAVSIIQVVLAPQDSATTALGEVTRTTEEAAAYEIGGAIWLSLAGAALLILAGVLVLLASGRWRDAASSKKYDRQASPAAEADSDADPDEFDLWDGLSAGSDPTDRGGTADRGGAR